MVVAAENEGDARHGSGNLAILCEIEMGERHDDFSTKVAQHAHRGHRGFPVRTEGDGWAGARHARRFGRDQAEKAHLDTAHLPDSASRPSSENSAVALDFPPAP